MCFYDRMLKVTSLYASGPDDVEDMEVVDSSADDFSDDIASRDELGDWFQWVSWFQQEDGIIMQLAEKLPVSDNLEAEWRERRLWVCLNGEEHVLPLSIDTHNSYIVISSLAHLARRALRLLVREASHG